MFIHVLKNKLKVLFRSKEIIFWTLIFPIVLGTFFKLALADISKEEEFNPIKIAIVEDDVLNEEKKLKEIIESLSKDDENQVFELTHIQEKEEAKELLQKGDIEGFVVMNEEKKADIIVKESGIEQTIIKYVIDEYYQMTSVANQAITYNPQVLYNGTLDMLKESKDYLDNKSKDNIDYCVNYYYTLIAMACIYGGFFGIEAVKETEANLSKRAARVSVSPVHKLKMLSANLIAGFIIQYLEILALLAYVIFVLGGDFGTNTVWVLLLSLVGCLAGTSFGMFLGVANKKNENMKVGILIAITMACCFFAGMMGSAQTKHSFEKLIPLIKYNPVSLITDGLYSLYSYSTLDMYFEKLICLIIFSAIMLGLSYVFIRRKRYDSI